MSGDDRTTASQYVDQARIRFNSLWGTISRTTAHDHRLPRLGPTRATQAVLLDFDGQSPHAIPAPDVSDELRAFI
ncbi:hypothetical protein [Kribbella soli]|uniref:Uncharacterized protein n=1 Tax=Kribbella soli TaxID=1124743 RepID=A0A4R0HMB7_9ACTN|nr:hypothetical protein [Kribbella soli]TCC10332.1 hypothetical protein E0H45_03130 [Kribbella soli]